MASDQPGATAEVDEPAAVGAPPAASAPTVTGPALPHAPLEGGQRANGASGANGANGAGAPSPATAAEVLIATDPEAPPPMRRVRRGRRVKRVIRRIELWSVLKLGLVFYTCMYVVVMGALVIIWGFAYSAGLVDNFESFANDVGFEHWQFYGEHMFRQAAVIGGVMVVAATVLTVLATALVNVISELTGGIRVVVIEEDVIEVPITDDGRGARRGAHAATGSRAGRRGPSAADDGS